MALIEIDFSRAGAAGRVIGVWEASYKAWGVAQEVVARVSRVTGEITRNSLRFHGQQIDDESGLHGVGRLDADWLACCKLFVDRRPVQRPGHQLLDQCWVKVQAVVPGSIVTSSLRLRGIKVVPWLSVYASHKRSDKLRPGKKMVAGFAPRFIGIITTFCGIMRER